MMMKMGLVMNAVVALLLALAGCEAAEEGACDARGVSCLRKPEKCQIWRKAQFVEHFPAYKDAFSIRKLYKCNRDPRKSRCCWAEAGLKYTSVATDSETLVQTSDSEASDEDDEDLPSITCKNPKRLSNGSWSDIEISVVGDFEDINLFEGNISIPVYGDSDPPAACTFIISNLRYQLDDEQESSTLPVMGVIDLDNPSKGRCTLNPNKDSCSCNTNDGTCPGVCLPLKRHEECQHCTRQECAARCDGDFSCAAMEYNTNSERCWVLYRPAFMQNVDLTGLGDGVSEMVPSFTVAQPLSVPPPIEAGSKKSGTYCYGRTPDAALNSKSVEVTDDDGAGGRCAIADSSNRVQKCGSYFGNMGQCGPAECASLCRQDSTCMAHEYNENFKRGQCFNIFEDPSGVEAGTEGQYRCFAVDRTVDAFDSDWFHDYRNHGFRDLSTVPGGDPIDLYDITNNAGVLSVATKSTPSPTVHRNVCSLNGSSRCCSAISNKRKRCCKGKATSANGRQCCVIVTNVANGKERIAKCCSKYKINGEKYHSCISNPSSSGEYAAIISAFT